MAKEYRVWRITTKTLGTFKFWTSENFMCNHIDRFIFGQIFDENKQQFEKNWSWLNLDDIVIATEM